MCRTQMNTSKQKKNAFLNNFLLDVVRLASKCVLYLFIFFIFQFKIKFLKCFGNLRDIEKQETFLKMLQTCLPFHLI